MVSYFVSRWRNQPHARTRKRLERLAPKQAAALLCKRPNDRSDAEHQLFQRLTEKNPTFAYMHALAIDFRDALQQRDGERVQQWIQHATQSGVVPLVRFAWGLRRDFTAVVAAAANEWSSGQVEGQINRLKTIKRQMYGRTGFYCSALEFSQFHPTSRRARHRLHRMCGRAHFYFAPTVSKHFWLECLIFLV